MLVQVKCVSCGLCDNIDVESIEEIKGLNCEVCHGQLKLVQEITEIKVKNLTILKPETLELTFTAEETEAFPALKSGKLELPKNIQLRPHNPECHKKECWCITKNGKNVCLKLLHKKPEGDFKELFEIVSCELNPESNVEETEIEELGE